MLGFSYLHVKFHHAEGIFIIYIDHFTFPPNFVRPVIKSRFQLLPTYEKKDKRDQHLISVKNGSVILGAVIAGGYCYSFGSIFKIMSRTNVGASKYLQSGWIWVFRNRLEKYA